MDEPKGVEMVRAREAQVLSKLKFLQIHTFYSSYLETFYKIRPQLSAKSYSEQMDAILRDGFSASHIFPPFLPKEKYDSQFILGNCVPLQGRWTHENRVDSSKSISSMDIVRAQVEQAKPDILYLSDPITFDSRFIRTLTWKPKLILGWRAAAYRKETDLSLFDLILSHLSPCRELALKAGARAVEHFFPGFPEFISNEVQSSTKKWDVLFSGQYTREHENRNRYLNKIAEISNNSHGSINCGMFLANPSKISLPANLEKINQGARWAMEMYRTLKSGKIVINGEIGLACGEAGNMRMFETTGVGAFLLTEYHPNISQFFEPRKEIETFRNPDELKEKILYYLDHEEEREAIAKRGQARCLDEYSIKNRADEFDRIITAHLKIAQNGRKAISTGITNPEADKIRNENVNQLLNLAITQLQNGRLEDALRLIDQTPKLQADNQDIIRCRARILQRLEQQSPKSRADSEISKIYEQAQTALDLGSVQEAFSLLNRAKALRTPRWGLDLLRAKCFLTMNRQESARESLKEEIRYFPQNEEAAALLNEISDNTLVPTVAGNGFNDIYRAVQSFTMLGKERLFSLYSLAKRVCLENLSGSIVECGVAAGGSTALLASVVKQYSNSARQVYAFDSFEGMPTPTEKDAHKGIDANSTGWGTGTCSAPIESVNKLCRDLNVQALVTAIPGYFEETLPEKKEEIGPIAFLHMDGDWYSSTVSILENLYDQVQPGGIIQIDDYGYWDGCRKAIQEFFAKRNLQPALNKIDGTGVWFVKGDNI